MQLSRAATGSTGRLLWRCHGIMHSETSHMRTALVGHGVSAIR